MKKTKLFTVGYSAHISGDFEVYAESLEEAREQAEEMLEEEYDYHNIQYVTEE